MSMDTIAIAVSVLFATAGYLLQCASNALSDECLFCFHDKPFAYSSTAECRDRRAYTARRAEQSAQAQAQEDHIAELARNRQHEQLLAQIARTDQWIDRCCRPLRLALKLPHNNGLPFTQMAAELEMSHPEIFSEMFASASLLFPVGQDGLMRSARSGRVYWTPWSDDFCPTVVDFRSQFPSASICSIYTAFSNKVMRRPYGRELPSQMLRLIEAEPSGKVACQWRRSVETSLLPAMDRIANLLLEHSATIEWPPIEWYEERYPTTESGNWLDRSNFAFAEDFLEYKSQWAALVADWRSGVHDSARPHFFAPATGLFAAINWSLKRGQRVQQELVGMTIVAEDEGWDYYASYAKQSSEQTTPNDDKSAT